MRLTIPCLITALVAAVLPPQLAAQDSTQVEPGARAMASRAELQSMLQGASGDQRAAIQGRLERGDFNAGDLIALTVVEESTLTDTFTVRTGQVLKLPNIPEFSLHGLLRSELQDFMARKIAEYVRNPQVDAVALVRVAVTGAVNRPGFFNVPADIPVSQVVMVAGGPSNQASLQKVELRRGDSVIVARDRMSSALAAGTSLDQLNIHGGDQFVVGEKPGGWRGTLQTIGLLTGLFTGIYFATRIF
ncbi:MAG TPA: SLBB domain-containing protein [Gemmatimonadales bacterium]|nr:SLBB domain-containing protein [Gemmatimonadales bacterium]